jgi:prepilin-type N-terminal cleavage/methylation domain-containing protein
MGKRHRRGFSLTEMVVVMAILLILYSISMIYITVLTRSKAKISRIVAGRDAAHESYLRRSAGGR